MDGTRTDVDVVVVGAGMAGLYSLHHLRELGFTAIVIEAGGGVGGTWYWNRYPGARCDVPSLEYSFGFSEDLQQEWEWSEVFPGQEELERYFNHVADRFDLRRDIRLNTRVVAATFDEERSVWTIETDAGDRITCRFCVMATGPLSAPSVPDVPGRDSFRGLVIQTSRWPQGDLDLEGKRIGLIGTGSSGVQSTPELAAVAGHLYVFQRTPTYTWPSHNGPLDADVQAAWKRDYVDVRRRQRENPGGVTGSTGAIILQGPGNAKILESTEEERLRMLDERGWDASRAWSDVATDPEANEMGCELFREMVRRTVHDPEVADALSPKGYPIGCKRPVIDSNYFETFNRDNVTLVDLRRGGIEADHRDGDPDRAGPLRARCHRVRDRIRCDDGRAARVSTSAAGTVPCSATSGPTVRARTSGIQMAGFPNLFMISGPGSPSVLANMVVCSEQHVEWIGACLAFVRDHGFTTVEPTTDAQDAWVEHVNQVAQGTMFTATTCNSWYLGANIPGKPRVFLPYVGGLPAYIEKVDAIAAAGYEGFALA